MAGNQEYSFSPENAPAPQEAGQQLLNKAHEPKPGGLTYGINWRPFEAIIPGTTKAGVFVDVLKGEKRLKTTSKKPFMLGKAIWHEAVGLLPNTLHQELSGEARALLIALVGGQLYATAVAAEIPERVGDFYEDVSTADPYSLSNLFALPLSSSMQLFDGGPVLYRQFHEKMKQQQLFSGEELSQALDIVRQETQGKGRYEEYVVGSRVLLETFIGKLQQAKRRELEQAPLQLPFGTRRIVAES